jgi:tetratricopeptide (TPR) repeat protein
MSKRFVCLLVTIVLCGSIIAQVNNTLQDAFLEAEYFFMNGDYSDAVTNYQKLSDKLPENANIAYRLGNCYLNIPGKKNLAIEYLENASKNISAKHKEGTINQTSAPYDALYCLGKAYRINYKFDKAKEAFKKYSGTLLPEDHENIDFINHEIQTCEMANKFIANPVEYTEENIGELFNDEKANFNPLISADGKSFVYKVTLKFYDAIMFSRLVDGKWTAPVNISPDLQTDGDLYISCLSADGKLLFLSKNDNFNSEIFSSSFNGTVWSKPILLKNKNINTKYWESNGFISEDGNSFVFASDRPGGSGGLDLYISHKVNGDWGPAVNLGSGINTQFNEDRPFLINNGKSLFFCSQGHENMGGYDLFRSDLLPDGSWDKPKNLGYPINTPDDNTFFMPIGDGKSGYYSVFKTSGGFGKEDIYKITFK